MWDVPNNFAMKWLECLQVLCDDTADNNCPVTEEIGLHVFVRKKFCKLYFFNWLLTLLIL